MKNKRSVIIKELFMIAVGCVLYALGIALFLSPNKLAPGGISGISVIINQLTGGAVSTGTLIFALNIPILILSFIKLGRKQTLYTVYSLALISVFTGVIEYFTGGDPIIPDDLLVNTVAGAALMALGIGINFRNSSTTGGTDIIVKVLRQKFPHIKTNVLMLVTDAMVITASAIAFKDLRVAIYAGVVVLASSVLLDLVLYGGDKTGLMFIISDECELVTEKLLSEADCGVTLLDGVGAYRNVNRRVIMVALHKQTVPKAKKLVGEIDPNAFVIMTSATQVIGYRFKRHDAQEL